MNKTISFLLSLIIIVLNLQFNSYAQTIEQQLVVVQNDGIVGGSFRVGVQVKGTNLPAANTIGSATIDVQFNNTHLTYINATNSSAANGPVPTNGYTKSHTNNTTFIRIGVLGTNVGPEGFPGFDLGTTYTTWSTLNFTIQNTVTTSLTINNATNAIGLFENHANDPATGEINDQPLTSPVNIIDAPLPVELTSFTSKLVNDKIQLNWETKTEVNNYGFNVERRINEGEWNTLGFVEGHGNSNSPKEYSYSDKDLFAGGSRFQYRLKQVDTDGQFEYSDVVEVEVVPTQFELSQNYPNPFNPSTTIQFSIPSSGHVNLTVFNILGEQVAELLNESKEAGLYKINFNASELNSGVYIYKLSAGNFSETKKLMVIK